jgi:hypothetical protein
MALGMLHPDEPSVACVALLEIADTRREGVTGRDFRTVTDDKDCADFADPVWAQGSGAQSRLNLGAGCRALTIHLDLKSFLGIRPEALSQQRWLFQEQHSSPIPSFD